MLEHPGNKIISRAGIVFSGEMIQQDNIEFEVDQIPALQHSLYFALKTCLDRPSYVSRQYIFDLRYFNIFPLTLTHDIFRHFPSSVVYIVPDTG